MAATAIDSQPYASLNDEACERRTTRAREIAGERVTYRDNRVSVGPQVAENARIALERKLDI